MKCEGSENPPCNRCRKVGRECVPQTSSRQKGTVETQRFDTSSSQVSIFREKNVPLCLGAESASHLKESSPH